MILAAGSVPRTLPGFEIDGKIVVTSDEFLDLTALPERAIVIGGGAIGCEFASLLSDMGTQVTILEALPAILVGCDTEVANVVSRSFKKRGIETRTGVKITGHTPKKGSTTIAIEGAESVETDMVVMSVDDVLAPKVCSAKAPASSSTSVASWRRTGYMRTAAANVYAVGDVVAGTPQLAHVGFAEAIVAIKTILGEPAVPG